LAAVDDDFHTLGKRNASVEVFVETGITVGSVYSHDVACSGTIKSAESLDSHVTAESCAFLVGIAVAALLCDVEISHPNVRKPCLGVEVICRAGGSVRCDVT
jgi:hypothetical protein